jgi:hypothetical protein
MGLGSNAGADHQWLECLHLAGDHQWPESSEAAVTKVVTGTGAELQGEVPLASINNNLIELVERSIKTVSTASDNTGTDGAG